MADRELTDLTDTGKAIAGARLLLTQSSNSRQVSPANFLKVISTLTEAAPTDTGDDWMMFYSDTGQKVKKMATGAVSPASLPRSLGVLHYWLAN